MNTESPDPTDPDDRPEDHLRPEDAPTAVHPAPPADGPSGLYRSAGDRMLFGVCGGIAERYGFEPLLVRLAFLAALFLGGAGIFFYFAAAVLIPGAPDGTQAPAARGSAVTRAGGGALRVLVGLAVAIAAFTALCAIAVVSFGTTALLGAWPAAVALLLLAGLLVASARSRRATGALLVLALALAVPATAAVVADVDVDRTFGERDQRPGTVSRAEAGYRLGVGQSVLDLRDLPLRDGARVRVPARVDVGQLAVILPRNRCVAWTVRYDVRTAGEVDVFDRTMGFGPGGADGVTEIDPPRDGGDRRPRVQLDLRVGVGHMAISHSRAAIDGYGARGRGILRDSDDLVRTASCRDEDREARRG